MIKFLHSIIFFIIFNFFFCGVITAIESNHNEKIIFIYNASDDFLSVKLDFLHKIISPKTYQCSLCKVTYGNFSMHSKWREYINSNPYEIQFLYKNSYKNFYKELEVDEYPSAFIIKGNQYNKIISKVEFDSCKDLDALINLFEEKLTIN